MMNMSIEQFTLTGTLSKRMEVFQARLSKTLKVFRLSKGLAERTEMLWCI